LVNKVNSLESEIQALSDAQLKEKTEYFRAKFDGVTDKKKQQKIVNDILPEAFAVVREASIRVTGKRHFDVQLIGGMVLN
jgi:preprotein translocase subunit SecA